MIDKTMCEVLWRNISDFYVNLRVDVGKHPQVILAMYDENLNMKYWHLHLPFGQHISVSTLKIKQIRLNYLCQDLKPDFKSDIKHWI